MNLLALTPEALEKAAKAAYDKMCEISADEVKNDGLEALELWENQPESLRKQWIASTQAAVYAIAAGINMQLAGRD